SDWELRRMHEGLGAEVYYMFGQTETTTGLVTTRRTTDFFTRPRTLGKPHGLMDVRIIGADGDEVPVGEVGELQYRGPTVFAGYYNNPEATDASFDDGWFKSGDLVRMDEDGYL